MPDDFRTSDLHIAAYLQAMGVVRSGIDRSPGGKVTFLYEDGPKCESLLETAYAGKVEISMVDYWSFEESLKDVIFGGRWRQTTKRLQFSNDRKFPPER